MLTKTQIATFSVVAVMTAVAVQTASAGSADAIGPNHSVPPVVKNIRTQVGIGKLGSLHPEPLRTFGKSVSVNPAPIAVIDPYPTATGAYKGLKGVTGFKGLKGGTEYRGVTGFKGAVGFKGANTLRQRAETGANIDAAMRLDPAAFGQVR